MLDWLNQLTPLKRIAITRLALLFLGCLLWLSPRAASAAEPGDAAPDESAEVSRAREAFLAGAQFAAELRWSEALERFEESARLRAHPGTSYNIGICQRALGQYTRAQRSLRAALVQAETTPLAPSLLADTKAVLSELDGVLSVLELTLTPKSARLTLDGRPLEASGRPGEFIAGLAQPGRPRSVQQERFRVVLDPGSHLLVLSRKGYADVVQQFTTRPGGKHALKLELGRLPGSLNIRSNRSRAAVSVDGVDVGVAPVRLTRPAGSYRVAVRQAGFESYVTDARLQPGEQVTLRAMLEPERVALSQRWWFWAGVGVLAAGIAVTTYALTRPEPERPPLSGGSLGWTVEVP